MRSIFENHITDHAGLLLDHLVPDLTDQSQKPERVAKFIKVIESWSGGTEYQTAYNHYKKCLSKLPHVIQEELSVQDRLIVGLGAENPLEVSITLNRLYGVPMIPGSALKGVARSYAEQIKQSKSNPSDQDQQDKIVKQMIVLFGDTTSSGKVTFYDAWWVPDRNAPLKKDVMTVHHEKYYSDRGKTPPSDFDDPNPVSFISSTGTFLFSVQGVDKDWSQLAMGLLKGGLAHLGVGAKTSSGYGRFGDSNVAGPGLQVARNYTAQDLVDIPDDKLEDMVKKIDRGSARSQLPLFAERWVSIQNGRTKRAVGIAIHDKSRATGATGRWMQEINNYIR